MKRSLHFLRLLSLALVGAGVFSGKVAGAELSTGDFLERVRRPVAAESYARLKGIMQHRPDGGRMETLPVALTVLIRRDGTRAELLIDSREGYRILQKRTGETSVEPFGTPLPSEPAVQRFGLRPTDLAMSFLFYELVREESGTLVKGIPCRVLVLRAPDRSEVVRVYVARSYFFPLKAEFYTSQEALEGDPVRTLETGSFRKKNDLYYAEILNLYGPGWRSRVHFSDAELGTPDAAAEERLFGKEKAAAPAAQQGGV